MEVTSLYNLDKKLLEQKSNEIGFIRDNLEKVYRLIDILSFINGHPLLSESLVLKGGTAINLTVFNLPRLSVDIDLDFNKDCTRDEMLKAREEISSVLSRYMIASGYTISLDKSKARHSLDSGVYYYLNAGGNRDNIKIEINYSMRCHILPPQLSTVSVDFMDETLKVNALSPTELFGSKIKALLERTAARDLYDINNMIKFGLFDESELPMLKKCVLFYKTVGVTGVFSEKITTDSINDMTFTKIRHSLLPVLRKGEFVDLESMKNTVLIFLNELLILSDNEKAYLHEFSLGSYRPDLLFDDTEILRRIKAHPMAIWKCSKINSL